MKKAKKIVKNLKNGSKIVLEKVVVILVIFAVLGLSLPQISVAHTLEAAPKIEFYVTAPSTQIEKLPDTSAHREARITAKVWLTAYNSLPGQTDSTPCIGASGMDLCEHDTEDVIATNFLHLPFGTKVKFPELFGDKVFTVQDRMNKRYTNSADIWLKSYAEAKTFGRNWTTIEIY